MPSMGSFTFLLLLLLLIPSVLAGPPPAQTPITDVLRAPFTDALGRPYFVDENGIPHLYDSINVGVNPPFPVFPPRALVSNGMLCN